MPAGPTVVITDSNLDSEADEDVLREAGFTTLRLQAKPTVTSLPGWRR